jgi:NADPH:quinone reductase-like Zn-dependent oxidoreductase
MEATIAATRTETMRAVLQEGYGSADVLKLRTIAKPALADDRVLVRVHASSVNAADYHLIRGAIPVRLLAQSGWRKPKDPSVGSDLAGIVEAVGAKVTRLRPGDEVFGSARGAFAEYATAREDRLVPKPQRLSFAQAATLPIAATTALQGLRDIGRVQSGQRVVVYGAGGGVGTFAVQIAKALGADVTAVTGPRNLEIVGTLGADEVVDYTREDIRKRRHQYDVFLDVAANRSLLSCRRAVKPEGTFVVTGGAKGSALGLFGRIGMAFLLSKLGRPRTTFFIAKLNREDFVVLSALVEAGKLKPVIDRTYPLAQTAEAVRYALAGRARAKVVISIG